MPRWGLVAAALAACLTLPGCGGGKAPVKYRIALIPKGDSHQFWQSIRRGGERAAADLSAAGVAVEVHWDAPQREDRTDEQINIIERNARKAQGIVLAPQHSKLMVRPVEDAVKGGVPVVVIDSGLDKDELAKNPALIVKYVATDNYNGGKLAAEHLLKVLGERGKPAPRILLFPYQVGSESTEQREKGFRDHVLNVAEGQKKAGRPALTLLDHNQLAGATVESAERAAGPLLGRLMKEGVDGVFAVNESSASGMLNALRSQALNKKVLLMGFDTSDPLLRAVEEDDVIGLMVQDPYKMGYLGVWHVVQHLEGYDVAPDGKKELSTGEYVLTKENLKEQASRELFDPELQRQRKIDTPTYPKKK